MRRGALQSHLKVLCAIAFLLSAIGLVFIYSSSCIFAKDRFNSAQYFLIKQLLYLGLSCASSLVCAFVPLSFFKRRAPLIFGLTLLVMLLTLMPGIGIMVNGARRWLSIGGFTLQPSEFLKVSLFLYLAFLLDRKQGHIKSFVASYVPMLLVLLVPFTLLLLQPDFGSIVTIFITAFMVFFIAQFELLHLFLTVACALPLAIIAVVLRPYRLRRILIFLNPWSDPQGRGYQIIQSLIAIGSGSLWGLGVGGSKQKFYYLPMQHTDFIFSIIAEETGFVGASLLVLLFAAFFIVGIRIAVRLCDTFSYLMTLGYVLLITLTATINLMVATGLVPTKGLGLPFVSYGGSALMANFCMLGLIINAVRTQIARGSTVTSLSRSFR